MKLHRKIAGSYLYECGRVEIYRVASQQTRRATEYVWEIKIDDYVLPRCYDTKAQAVAVATRELERRSR